MPVFDFPPGTIAPHGSSVIPTGWVACDGSAYDGTQTAYSALWTALGTTYGGSGQSSFRVPSLGGRVPVGPKTSSQVSITNPSFATNTTGWTASSSVITRDTSTFDSSPASGRWDKSGTSNGLDVGSVLVCALSGTFTAGISYTFTWQMRATHATNWVQVAFGVVTSSWTDWGSTNFVNLNKSNFGYYAGLGGISTTGWTTCSISWTPTTTVNSGVNVVFNDRSAFFGATNNYFWFDSTTVTSTDGDGGLGTWFGSTQHLLTSGQTGVKYHRHGITEPSSGTGHDHGGSAAGNYSTHTHTTNWWYAGIDNKNTNNSTNQPDGNSATGQSTTQTTPSITYNSANLNSINVVENTAADATSAHSNLQPQMAVNYIIKL